MFCHNPDCPHLQATGEPAEYRIGIARCSDCDTVLVETRPKWGGIRPAVVYEEFVLILELYGPAAISFAKSLLQSAGIRFFIKGERVQDPIAFGSFGPGFNPITGPPILMVEPSKADEAKELLSAVERDTRGD